MPPTNAVSTSSGGIGETLRRAAGEIARSTFQGMLLGGAAGGVYGALAILVLAWAGGGAYLFGVHLTVMLPGAIAGAMLGAAGGACTGLVAGLLTKLAGARFTAIGWWLGGAIGGFLAASVVQSNELSVWWHGCPTVIGAGSGAVFGWWAQRQEAGRSRTRRIDHGDGDAATGRTE